MSKLNEFESAIPERIARMSRERLEQGREEYGAWEPTRDDRDFIAEAEAEFVDGFAYLQAVRAEMEDLRWIVKVQAARIEELEEMIMNPRQVVCEIPHGPFFDAVWRWHDGDVTRVRWTATTCEIDGMTARREDDAWTVPIDLWSMLTEERDG